ncbi:cystinosin homolog [Macrosteles quadrilineatus]|uniref:cystinosin homolog n=1 Tax=Macrosteles quadrilineatus TaxID=74068 RepID=UPI0023E0A75F|nr:cystinosin homolog [Macrosteles quadrilineatus]
MFPTPIFGFGGKTPKMLFLTFTFVFSFSVVSGDLTVLENELTILVGNTSHFTLNLTEPVAQELDVSLIVPEKDVLKIDPYQITVAPRSAGPWKIDVTGEERGHFLVYANVTPHVVNADKAFIRVTVQYSELLSLISVIIGWVYFIAWSISFYPQIYENFVRKSVVGLNFDFLALNIVGFTMYSLFNIGLYYVPQVEEEYFRRHPRGLNPVQLNDIVFAVHAAFATILTILQCFCYERGSQRVSTTARSILVAFFLIFVTCLGLALFNYIDWLDFLYDCSYIKLTITLIKYIPQAFMNYQRKSTVGWSIGNVLLDFTGGILSMGQMILNAYNYNDWVSIFGDPTKFGLGLFSVVFDILFIVQHYVLYRNPYEPIPGNVFVQATENEVITDPGGSETADSEKLTQVTGADDTLGGD